MINDIYGDGIASGWKVRDASSFAGPQVLEADVVIVGTGAGGGTAAEILSAAGLKVLMVEEGPLKTSASFKDMDESRAFRELYQEAAGRTTSDGAIGILQGRAVGGTTTVNWTSSFRTPPETLKHWAAQHSVKDSSVDAMAPWFQKMEERLGVAPWGMAPNANNETLKRGCEKLGWEWHVIPRNVRGCMNSGYCGFGCPVNAKQSMLVSTIPAALKNGAELVHHLRVQELFFSSGTVRHMTALALDRDCIEPTGVQVEIRARHYVLAGGAINTPALLLRSNVPDPGRRVGQRTFLHPVPIMLAQMPGAVNGWYGAPQSIASDEFQWKHDTGDAPGFKMEVPYIQPMFSSILLGHGRVLAEDLAQLHRTQITLALLRDGFHRDSPGGTVRVDASGAALLDYDVSWYLWRGVREAFMRMAQAQFAAGALRVKPAHLDAHWCSSWKEAEDMIERLPYKKFRCALNTAHQMGGCAMGEDTQEAVADSYGRHHHAQNLSIFDGSLFPTSIGANPQLSIYGFSARNATRLAQQMSGTKSSAQSAPDHKPNS